MGAVIEELRCSNIGIQLVNGISGTRKSKNGRFYKMYTCEDKSKKYVTNTNNLYSDKLSEFAYECSKKRKSNFIKHIGACFSSILIDEVQDLSAWDYDIVKELLKIKDLYVILCGDLRQKTYSTTAGKRWKKYQGRIDSFLSSEVNLKRKQYIEIDYFTLNKSHRFGQQIANFASYVIGNEYTKTESCNCSTCIKRQNEFKGYKGVVLVKHSDVQKFLDMHHPIVLVWDKRSDAPAGIKTYNYGESKGLSAETCLIYPTKVITRDLLSSKSNNLKELTRCKLYVAITRAQYISAIVIEDGFDNSFINLPFWSKEDNQAD